MTVLLVSWVLTLLSLFSLTFNREVRADLALTDWRSEEVQAAARKQGVEPPDLYAEAVRRGRYIQKHDPEFVKGT